MPIPASPLSKTTWPRPSCDLRPALPQQADFGLPPHQRGEAPRAGHVQATLRPALPHHTIHLEGRVHTLERVGAQIVADKIALHQLLRRGADDHGIGGRQPLEAGRNVRRLAQGELFRRPPPPISPTTTRPVWIPTRTASRTPCCCSRRRGERSHGLDHRQAGPHGPLRVVFMRQRIAKVDQQAIPQVLGNVPVKALDDRGTGGLVGPHHVAVVFRVELPGQRGRVHQVTEQDRELAAFGLWGRRTRRLAGRGG